MNPPNLTDPSHPFAGAGPRRSCSTHGGIGKPVQAQVLRRGGGRRRHRRMVEPASGTRRNRAERICAGPGGGTRPLRGALGSPSLGRDFGRQVGGRTLSHRRGGDAHQEEPPCAAAHFHAGTEPSSRTPSRSPPLDAAAELHRYKRANFPFK
eukprot:1180043-Prorocentrum_minimum.AAC.5